MQWLFQAQEPFEWSCLHHLPLNWGHLTINVNDSIGVEFVPDFQPLIQINKQLTVFLHSEIISDWVDFLYTKDFVITSYVPQL